MNQDFTVKKSNICLKKKFVQGISPGKKNSCTSSARKKKFVQAENPPPPPPITFLMVRPLQRRLYILLSNHRLTIEIGRYARPHRKPEERICPLFKKRTKDDKKDVHCLNAYIIMQVKIPISENADRR